MKIGTARKISEGLLEIAQGFSAIARAIEDECEVIAAKAEPEKEKPTPELEKTEAEREKPEEQPSEEQPPEQKLTREEVRAKLAAKASDTRFRSAVKALVQRYGTKLADVPEENFGDILRELEAMV